MALAPRGEVERKEQGDNRDPAQENGPERAAVEQNRERDKADEEDDGAAGPADSEGRSTTSGSAASSHSRIRSPSAWRKSSLYG